MSAPRPSVCTQCGLTPDEALGGACDALAGPKHAWGTPKPSAPRPPFVSDDGEYIVLGADRIWVGAPLAARLSAAVEAEVGRRLLEASDAILAEATANGATTAGDAGYCDGLCTAASMVRERAARAGGDDGER